MWDGRLFLKKPGRDPFRHIISHRVHRLSRLPIFSLFIYGNEWTCGNRTCGVFDVSLRQLRTGETGRAEERPGWRKDGVQAGMGGGLLEIRARAVPGVAKQCVQVRPTGIACPKLIRSHGNVWNENNNNPLRSVERKRGTQMQISSQQGHAVIRIALSTQTNLFRKKKKTGSRTIRGCITALFLAWSPDPANLFAPKSQVRTRRNRRRLPTHCRSHLNVNRKDWRAFVAERYRER